MKVYKNKKNCLKSNLNFTLNKDLNCYNKIMYNFKKVLHVIYKTHILNKRILFINVPLSLIKRLAALKLKISHFFVPEMFWLKGLLTNPASCHYTLLRKKTIDKKTKFLLKFNKKYSLIVFFKNNLKNTAAFKESLSKNIPIITINSFNTPSKFSNIHYVVNTDFENKKTNNNFIYTFLKTILRYNVNPDLNIYAKTLKKKSKKNFKNKYKYFKKHRKTFYKQTYSKNINNKYFF